MLATENAFERVTGIAEQVEAIGDLLRLGSTLPRSLSVGARAVATDHGRLGVLLKPRGERRRGAVGEEVDRPMGFQVHHDRAVALPFP
jgi:hypothetical protein